MPTLTKAFRFRMRPTPSQDAAMRRLAGARRFVWNWALDRRKAYYAETGKTIPAGQLSAELTALKSAPGMEWLKEAHAQSLQQALRDLDRAFRNFFDPKIKARYPRFKSKKRDELRFRLPQGVATEGGCVAVSKVGRVRIRQSRPIDGKTRSATFKRDALGRWFVTIVIEFAMPDVALIPPDPAKVIGIDVGLKDYATFSDEGESVPAPKFFRTAQRKLRKAQRVFSRRKVGSKRKAKAKRNQARVQATIKQQRGDFQHKLTTKIVVRYDGMCVEDLNLAGLARTKLAKSFGDAAFGEFFRQLTYKAEWNRRHFVKIDRWYPSSKLHAACGEINANLTLNDRAWTCGCGVTLDRDKNAAINIRDEGLRMLAAGHAESRNARGVRVRPAKAGIEC